MEVVFNEISYIKIWLHAIKYPDHKIDGILTGYLDEYNGKLHVTNCFPLTHGPKFAQFVTLGLQYIQEYCNIMNESEEQIGTQIIGYYYDYFEEDASSNKNNSHLQLLSEKIIANNDYSVKVALNCEDYFSSKGISVSSLKTGKSLECSNISANFEEKLSHKIKNMAFRKLSDFEDHLFDPKLDFTNSSL